ncbi:MAG: hypothetical protein IKY78_04310 [Clostridia bacterium]|nr:hypothetical protein [Clostridia bacterium]
MEGNYISFRKAKVGGFNKRDVISYIEKMRNDFFDYKVAVESTIDKLNTKVRELELACEDQKEQIREVIVEVPVMAENSTDPLSGINEATSQLKIVADELCRNLSDFMFKISTKGRSAEHSPAKPEIFEDVSAYIEETAKEIFEESPASVKKQPESDDKVSEILKSSMNFCFSKEDTVTSKTKAEESEKERDILDCLSSCSFLG